MHIDARLPEEIELGAVRRETMEIEVTRTDSGHEDRDRRWSQPLIEFDVAYPASLRTATVYQEVLAAFRATGFGEHSFDLEDWTDHEATDEPFGTGTGSEDTFPLIKTYSFGGQDFERRIYRPGVDLVVEANGVEVDAGDYTVSEIGDVVFDTNPVLGVALTWSGTFYVPVRFDMAMALTGMATHLDHIDSFTLVEVRLAAEDFTT